MQGCLNTNFSSFENGFTEFNLNLKSEMQSVFMTVFGGFNMHILIRFISDFGKSGIIFSPVF